MAHTHCAERWLERDQKANGLLEVVQNCSHYTGTGNGTGHMGSVQCD